jgi:phosphohistidine phosphatase
MKTLCIIRHAKTEEIQQGQLDFNRVLQTRGKNDAEEATRKLKKNKLHPNAIVCSPAVRALETAKIIAKSLDFPFNKIEQNSLIYNASFQTLLKLVNQLNDRYDVVFLIGHNPGLTLLCNYLGANLSHLPTSGIVEMVFENQNWIDLGMESGREKYFWSP